MKKLLTTIAQSNDCSVLDAKDLLEDALNVCREKGHNLMLCDLEGVCFDLGIDLDEIDKLLLML